MVLRLSGKPILPGLLACAAVVAGAVFVLERKGSTEADVVLWSNTRYGNDPEIAMEVRQFSQELRGLILDEVKFDNTPFRECLAEIARQIDERSPGMKPVIFRLGKEVSPNEVISMRLTKAPANQALFYLGILNYSRHRAERGRTIAFDILPLNQREGGWFRPAPGFLDDFESSRENGDVRPRLEAAGIKFEPGDVAIYYPEKKLIYARTTSENLELIDARLSRTHP